MARCLMLSSTAGQMLYRWSKLPFSCR